MNQEQLCSIDPQYQCTIQSYCCCCCCWDCMPIVRDPTDYVAATLVTLPPLTIDYSTSSPTKKRKFGRSEHLQWVSRFLGVAVVHKISKGRYALLSSRKEKSLHRFDRAQYRYESSKKQQGP
mmetsp:Transcript_19206/g.46350  ORF Transcript_19206/g.46350 Transcript_19206/m.46350 type:complete len:122 (+) Transcript_19206:692-1057(+)